MSLINEEEITPEFIQKLVVPRSVLSKKGDNGIILVVGGSTLYNGAPVLGSLAALRTGADLVFTAVPISNVMVVRSFSPNLIVLPIKDDNFTINSTDKLIELLPKQPHVVSIGMGLSIEKIDALIQFIREILNKSNNKNKKSSNLLLDASALIPEVLREISSTNTIITPHPGEYKRIFGNNNNVIGLSLKEQVSNVRKNAKEYGITIILKGYNNIICEGPTDRVAVIQRTTPAMTVGGSGDTLSGVTATLLSKVDSPFSASILGIYFTGKATSIAYEIIGLHMVATDIIDKLHEAMKPFDKLKELDNIKT